MAVKTIPKALRLQSTMHRLLRVSVCGIVIHGFGQISCVFALGPLEKISYDLGRIRYTGDLGKLTWKWRGALYKTTILHIGPSMSFDVNWGEGNV